MDKLEIFGVQYGSFCLAGMTVSCGHGPFNLKSSLGIIHNQLIVMVGHKQAQKYLQNGLECYQWISKKNYFSKFSTISLPYWCVQSNIAETGYSYSIANLAEMLGISWQKPFTILNTYVLLCSLTVLTLILLYDSHFSSVWLLSKVMLYISFLHNVRLPALYNDMPQQMTIL